MRTIKKKFKKNLVVILAIWGEVTSGATLTICGVCGDIVDVITCAIFGGCRLRGVGVVRGANSPSPIDLTRRPYNRVTVWLCEILGLFVANSFKITHKFFSADLKNPSRNHTKTAVNFKIRPWIES